MGETAIDPLVFTVPVSGSTTQMSVFDDDHDKVTG
jgi:hypothetical protein